MWDYHSQLTLCPSLSRAAAVAAAAGGYAASYDAYGNVLPAYGAQPLGQSLGLVGGSSAPPPMSSSSYGGGSSSYSSTRLCYR